MSTPVLDELSHKYHIDGKPLASVTRVIKSVWPNKPSFDGVDPEVLENARIRGVRVDYWTGEYAANDGAVEVEDRRDVIESVEFFDRWWKKVRPTYIQHQGMVWSEESGVCGTYDLLLDIGGTVTLIDVKRTANEEETWPIQVGAYRDLHNHMPTGAQFNIAEIGMLHLHPKFKNGYIWRKYPILESVDAWRSTIAFYQTFRRLSK